MASLQVKPTKDMAPKTIALRSARGAHRARFVAAMMQLKEPTMFDLTKVTNVYSGRKGCACGCRGKYSYASAYRDERPDYYEGDTGVSDRVVKTLVNKVEWFLRDGYDVESVMVHDDYFAVNMYHDRTYTLYFAE
jgi:hypothetical protein